jgi:hypothetical protein
MPKTGGTFVTSALFRLHGGNGQPRQGFLYSTGQRHPLQQWLVLWTQAALSRVRFGRRYGPLYKQGKHSPSSEIPPGHSHKPIVATLRNPYDWYVSQYHFRWWAEPRQLREFEAYAELQAEFPDYPNLSFGSFLKYYHYGISGSASSRIGLGKYTRRFVKTFFSRASDAYSRCMEPDYVASGRVRADMHGVHFLHMERLNRDLYDFLSQMGYDARDLEIVLRLGRILPGGRGRPAGNEWEKYYTPELRDFVRLKDRLIFELFPEFDAREAGEPRVPSARVMAQGSARF